ncbi:MAG TPA: glycosyltransferase family 4 protein, partial [Gemmata sp.]|nr:glycosyltransferase family 4 protein [Gemmata sp.]
KRHVYERLWRARMRSYTAVAAISEFSARWTRDWWGSEAAVVFPPVDVDQFAPGGKEDLIVALGRFSEWKNQAGLARVFRNSRPLLPGWRFSCVGGVTDSPAGHAYLAEVEREGGGAVELVVNATRERVRAEVGRAKVFWHAMGFNVDEQKAPVEAEHFGIATVEAMAAGCVPVVPNRGGQAEIVIHGESGFLCDSIEELPERTAELAANPARLACMSAAARERSRAFSHSNYVNSMMRLLRPHLLATEQPVSASPAPVSTG